MKRSEGQPAAAPQAAAAPGPPLTRRRFQAALRVLGGRDPDLGRILSSLGPPPLWGRKPGFPALVHIILEQQVSLASAQAAFDRLLAAVPALTPARFLALEPSSLRVMGFSRQKARYCRLLAAAICDGDLDLDGLERLDDPEARSRLTAIPGIGPWTADVYLLSALKRPDVLPIGDLALRKAVQAVKGLDGTPSPEAFHDLASSWRPWRAVAARLLWHHYLNPFAPRAAGSSTPNE